MRGERAKGGGAGVPSGRGGGRRHLLALDGEGAVGGARRVDLEQVGAVEDDGDARAGGDAAVERRPAGPRAVARRRRRRLHILLQHARRVDGEDVEERLRVEDGPRPGGEGAAEALPPRPVDAARVAQLAVVHDLARRRRPREELQEALRRQHRARHARKRRPAVDAHPRPPAAHAVGRELVLDVERAVHPARHHLEAAVRRAHDRRPRRELARLGAVLVADRAEGRPHGGGGGARVAVHDLAVRAEGERLDRAAQPDRRVHQLEAAHPRRVGVGRRERRRRRRRLGRGLDGERVDREGRLDEGGARADGDAGRGGEERQHFLPTKIAYLGIWSCARSGRRAPAVAAVA